VDRRGGLWDHDLWSEIYAIHDTQTRQAIADLYRLVLAMRNDDVLAQKIAAAVNARDKLVLTTVQKVIGGIATALIVLDTVLHLKAIF
jgi:hypothetical protein